MIGNFGPQVNQKSSVGPDVTQNLATMSQLATAQMARRGGGGGPNLRHQSMEKEKDRQFEREMVERKRRENEQVMYRERVAEGRQAAIEQKKAAAELELNRVEQQIAEAQERARNENDAESAAEVQALEERHAQLSKNLNADIIRYQTGINRNQEDVGAIVGQISGELTTHAKNLEEIENAVSAGVQFSMSEVPTALQDFIDGKTSFEDAVTSIMVRDAATPDGGISDVFTAMGAALLDPNSEVAGIARTFKNILGGFARYATGTKPGEAEPFDITSFGIEDEAALRDFLSTSEGRKTVADSIALNALYETGVLDNDSTPDQVNLVGNFVSGGLIPVKDKDGKIVSKRQPTRQDLENAGIDTYRLGFALKELDSQSRALRQELVPQRDLTGEDAAKMGVSRQLEALSGITSLGFGKMGSDLIRGRGSGDFTGLAAVLAQDDLRHSQLIETIDKAIEGGLDEDEIFDQLVAEGGEIDTFSALGVAGTRKAEAGDIDRDMLEMLFGDTDRMEEETGRLKLDIDQSRADTTLEAGRVKADKKQELVDAMAKILKDDPNDATDFFSRRQAAEQAVLDAGTLSPAEIQKVVAEAEQFLRDTQL